MKYIKVDASQVLNWDDVYDEDLGTHGRFKIGFGKGSDSVDNPTSVCVKYNSGDRLLETVGFSHGDSEMGATMGGDRNIVVADKPFALAEDTDCHILGVLKSRQGSQPDLFEGSPLAKAIGGASWFSSFVSETGAPEEDPSPREVRDSTQPDPYYTNRLTGHAAWGDYYVHVYRLNVNEDQAYPALTLETSGRDMEEEVIYPKPVDVEGTIIINGKEYRLVPVE